MLLVAAVIALIASSCNAQVVICGHVQDGGDVSCTPINSGQLFIAIAPWTMFPFLVLWAVSLYCCLKENPEGVTCLRSRDPPPPPPPRMLYVPPPRVAEPSGPAPGAVSINMPAPPSGEDGNRSPHSAAAGLELRPANNSGGGDAADSPHGGGDEIDGGGGAGSKASHAAGRRKPSPAAGGRKPSPAPAARAAATAARERLAAAASEAANAGGQWSSGVWECPTCTALNPAGATMRCSVCEAKKPARLALRTGSGPIV